MQYLVLVDAERDPSELATRLNIEIVEALGQARVDNVVVLDLAATVCEALCSQKMASVQ